MQVSSAEAANGPGSAFDAAAELIARFGDADRIRAEHSPDRNERCRACTTPGYGTPHAPWPCVLYIIATDAPNR